MTQINHIRKLYYEEGKSITEISRETGRDRKTVRVYIEKEDWNEMRSEVGKESEFPKLDPFKTMIDEWLIADKMAKRKQRHTATRVYDRLVEYYGEGFTCSYRTVAGYVARKKKELFAKKTGVLPLEHIPGEAQVDFGAADYYENGRRFEGHYLNLSFPYSNQGYFQLFKGENQECLFEGLLAIFEHIGGVPYRIWFDNASTMVVHILKHGERHVTDSFLRFKEHYRFEAVFCNKNAGYEKGNVEGKVGYHRRNMLVPIPRFENLATFNKEQLEKCDTDAQREHYRKDSLIADLHQKDREALLGLPSVPLDVSQYVTLKTNGYGRFYLNSGLHEYSVSPKYANNRVVVKITANEVIPMDEHHREVVRHERLYGAYKQQSMKWLPYLTQLSRCPGALKYTGVYAMLPESIQSFLERCHKGEVGKVLQAIANLTEQSGFERAVETVDYALQYEATDTDSLLNLHRRLHGNVMELAPIRLAENVPDLTKVIPNLADYDSKLKKAGVPSC